MDHSLSNFESYETLWAETAALPYRGILRLALLRSIHHDLHAQASHFLAIGQKDLTRSLQLWDLRVHELGKYSLRENSFESCRLADFLTYADQLPQIERTLSEKLLIHLDPKKFNRSDRTWEKLIAGEANALGWHYWKMSTQMSIHLVENWNQSFSKMLWPNGIILWIDAAETSEEIEKSKIWRGNWLIALSPEISQPWVTFQIPSEFPMEWTVFL